eukprot:41093-Prorocentrum_minimum.AAC.2
MAADPQMWQKLIQEKFVDNAHRVTVAMTPSQKYNADLEAGEKERLQKIEAALDQERRWAVVRPLTRPLPHWRIQFFL